MATYVKLFGSILDSTVWATPAGTRLTWITMLAMADEDGCIWASVPGLAKRAGVSRVECERALDCLSAPDPDSRTPDFEGRRIETIDGGWLLLNHAKFRNLMSIEDRRAKAAERQRRWKERHRQVTPPVTQGNAESREVTQVTTSDHIRSNSEETIAPQARVSFDIEALCKRYPRRKGVTKGKDKLNAAIKTQADFDAVSRGLDRFLAEQKRKGTEIDFYPYFSTWVNQRRWEDEDDPVLGKERGAPARAEPLSFAEVFGNGYADEVP